MIKSTTQQYPRVAPANNWTLNTLENFIFGPLIIVDGKPYGRWNEFPLLHKHILACSDTPVDFKLVKPIELTLKTIATKVPRFDNPFAKDCFKSNRLLPLLTLNSNKIINKIANQLIIPYQEARLILNMLNKLNHKQCTETDINAYIEDTQHIIVENCINIDASIDIDVPDSERELSEEKNLSKKYITRWMASIPIQLRSELISQTTRLRESSTNADYSLIDVLLTVPSDIRTEAFISTLEALLQEKPHLNRKELIQTVAKEWSDLENLIMFSDQFGIDDEFLRRIGSYLLGPIGLPIFDSYLPSPGTAGIPDRNAKHSGTT